MEHKKFYITDLSEAFSQLHLRLDILEDSLGLIEAAIVTESTKEMPITIEDAAAIINLSVTTIYAMVRKNQLPYHKKQKRLYFFHNELIGWIKSRNN